MTTASMASPSASRRPEAQPRLAHARTDIQALRAFAVSAVVLYHVWPGALRGGYIGVDIFFVISGFLITSQLLKRRESGRIGLGSFWTARARRLLPASLTVLAASAVLTLMFAPAVVQSQYLRSILGSTFYIENWVLAADAVDYLGQDNAPPITQHYWSLSVEEQFYLLWPLILLAAAVGAAGFVAARRRTLIWIAVIAVASFALSVYLTTTSPAYGYFATFSRMWEFGLGALVALLPGFALPAVPRAVMWVMGWAAMALPLLAFGPDTSFPGPWALLPTAGAATVIAIGSTAPARLLDAAQSSRPVQWVGDQSYSIYLWHWPLIIIAPAILGRATNLPENVAIIALTVTLAAATKRWIEDPLRFGTPKRWRPHTVGLVSLMAMLLVAALAIVPQIVSTQASAEREEQISGELTDSAACRGASVLLSAECAARQADAVAAEEVVPALSALYEDTGGAFACYTAEPTDTLVTCTFGSDSDDATRIALTGDSHAAMLIPGLREIADERNWQIDTFVGRGCVWLISDVKDECTARRTVIDERLTSGDYDAVLVTARNADSYSDSTRSSLAQGYAQAWAGALSVGTQVIALTDNPLVPQASADCLATATEFTLETCAFAFDQDLVASDPLRAAAAAAGVPTVDMIGAYCADASCPMVMGGVVVYRDLHHITATFSRTLAPYLAQRVDETLTSPRT